MLIYKYFIFILVHSRAGQRHEAGQSRRDNQMAEQANIFLF
jgi:hypothetical protein